MLWAHLPFTFLLGPLNGNAASSSAALRRPSVLFVALWARAASSSSSASRAEPRSLLAADLASETLAGSRAAGSERVIPEVG